MTHEERSQELTSLQDRFVDEYLKDPTDGGEAYMKASGKTSSKKSASTQASKLLKMPKVQKALKDRAKNVLGLLESRIIQNVEFWIDIRDGVNPGFGEGPLIAKDKVFDLLEEHGYEKGQSLYDKMGKLFAFKVSPLKLADRMKASENLGKYMQMFVEKKEIDVSAQVQIVDDIK